MQTFADLTEPGRGRFLDYMVKQTGMELAEVTQCYIDDPDGTSSEFATDFAAFMGSGNPLPVSVAPEPPADDFVPLSICRAVKLVTRAEHGRTRSNLGVADELVKSIDHTLLTVCKAHEDVNEWREDTIGRFTKPISLATGLTLTTKKLSEYLKVRYLVDSLPSDVAAKAQRVNWESLRTLARWITHIPGETTFSPGEEYTEQWNVTTGCETRLADLVTSLASKPQSSSDLRKALDSHEESIGIAKPGKATVGRQQRIADLCQSIRTDAAKLGVDLATPGGLATLAEWMLDDGCLTIPAVVSAAETISRRAQPSQPNKRATATVDDSGIKRDDPLKHPAAQTRVISQPASAAA